MFFREIKIYFPPLIWGLFVVVGSLTPSNELPNQLFVVSDKLLHLVAYALWTLLLGIAFTKQKSSVVLKNNNVIVAFIFTVVVGAIIEVMQGTMIHGREGDWMDLVFNILGALLVVPLFFYMCGTLYVKK